MDTCPLLSGLCKYSLNLIRVFYVQIAVMIIGIVFGVLLMWQPRKVIDTEIAIYRPFNWKIAPRSMEKEIRNIRTMGLAVFIMAVASLILVYCNQF